MFIKGKYHSNCEDYYDDIYFDSSGSSSEGEGGSERTEAGGEKCGGATRKVKKLTNDELFYDPNMDEEDERWVRRQRMAYHNGMKIRDKGVCAWVGDV